MSIRTKLTFTAIFGIIALTSVINIFSFRSCKAALREQNVAQLSAIADSTANHLRVYLKEELEKSRILAHVVYVKESLSNDNANIQDLDKFYTEANENLAVFKATDNHLESIKVLDDGGKVVLSSDLQDIGEDVSSALYFTEGLKDEYIGDAFTSRTGSPVFTLSSPVVNTETGSVGGVIVMTVEMTVLSEVLSNRTGMGETGEVYLINEDNYLITPSRFVEDSFLNVRTENADDVCIGENGNHEHGSQDSSFVGAGLYSDYRNVLVLGASVCVPDVEWCVVAEMDAEEAFGPALILGRTLFLMTIIFTAGGIAVASVITRFISDPILSLCEGTKKIANGDWNVKLKIKSGDEIEDLSDSFGVMSEKIREAQENLEAKVQQRTQELETMIESAPIGIFLVDAETHVITRANKSATKMLRMPQEEICGQGCQHLLCSTRKGGCPVMDRGEDITRAECHLSLKDGTELTAMKSVNKVTIDGKAFLLETFVDITEMKGAEIALMHSEERMRAILDHSPAFVSLKHVDGTYIFINEMFEKLFGIKNYQIMQKRGHDVLPKEIADILAVDDDVVLETREPVEKEEIIPFGDKQMAYLSVKFPLLDRFSKPYAICTICADITERIEAEKELNEKMKELEEFNQLAVGRELRMIELKQEINELMPETDEEAKYEIVG